MKMYWEGVAADERVLCRRGKVFYQNPVTNETMLWNLFWSNSTVAVVVRPFPSPAWHGRISI